MCVVTSECSAGMFGLGCRHRCQCDNKAMCDHVSGACTCQVGWTGTFCEKRKRVFYPQSHIVYLSLTAGGQSVFVCMFQLVLRVSMEWTVRRSVCVSTVASVITSTEFVPVPLAGPVHSATTVSDHKKLSRC